MEMEISRKENFLNSERKSGKTEINLHDQYNLQYFCNLGFGTPSQSFSVVIDTGSSDTWIPSAYCTETFCLEHHQYDRSVSKTYEGDQGRKFSFTYPFWNNYAKVSGNFSKDVVTIGTFTTKDVFEFGEVFSVVGFSSDDAFGSIAGVAYPALSTQGRTHVPLFDFLHDEGFMDEYIFSFYLSRKPGSYDSVMTLGGIDEKYYTGEIEYFDVIDTPELNAKGYWLLEMTEMYIDGQSLGCKEKKDHCKASVATGTSSLICPQQMIQPFAWKVTPEKDCSNMEDLVPITIELGGKKNFTITPEEYVVETNYQGETVCIQGVNAGTPDDVFILGDAFLRNFYTVLDRENDRVGFAQVKTN